MAEKKSLFGRIAQLVKANANSAIDAAEDPQKMLDQTVRDYTNNIAEAEASVAQTIGNLRLLQDDYREDLRTAEDWGRKALAASTRADGFRAAGDTVDAAKFDELARVAITRRHRGQRRRPHRRTGGDRREAQVRADGHEGQAGPAGRQTRRAGGAFPHRRRAEPNDGRGEVHRPAGSRQRGGPLRRRSAARRPRSAARRNCRRRPWTPSSRNWRAWARSPRWRPGWRRSRPRPTSSASSGPSRPAEPLPASC